MKRFRHYLNDGKSYTESDVANKKQVAVAIIPGYEQLKAETDEDFFDVDEAILKLAENIKEARKKKGKRNA